MLSDEEIDAVWPSPEGTNSIRAVARAIEAEVRKQDEALIRQLLEALEAMQSYARADGKGLLITDEALAAGRARLEGES